MLLKLLLSIFKGRLSSLLPELVRLLAEGKFGAAPAKVYTFLSGKKTYLSIALYIVWGALGYVEVYVPGVVGYAGYVLQAANFLLVIGLFDGAVKFEPPKVGG